MLKRHLQVRVVKDSPNEESAEVFPIDEVVQLVDRIFIGIGALILLNTVGKILINKFS